jgi:hypothetical protein
MLMLVTFYQTTLRHIREGNYLYIYRLENLKYHILISYGEATLGNLYQTTRCHIPDDSNLYSHRCENLEHRSLLSLILDPE